MASVRVHKYMIVRSKRDQSSSSQLYLDNLSARQFSSHSSVQLGAHRWLEITHYPPKTKQDTEFFVPREKFNLIAGGAFVQIENLTGFFLQRSRLRLN